MSTNSHINSNAKQELNFIILIPILSAIAAITPLAIDMYLPAMKLISADLNSNITTVQQSLSTYLIGYACGMLVFGPLTDRFGRRPLVIFGLSGFMLTSFALAFVQSIETFFILRFIQAFIGAAATVVIPGYIKQVYGDNTAKGMSYVSLIMMLAPLLAPNIGSYILKLGSWHLIFFVLSAYAFLLLFLVILKLHLPSNNQHDGTQKKRSFFNAYYTVLTYPDVKLSLCCSILTSFAFFCYLTAASFIYTTVFGLDESTFSILFSINVGALMLANILNSRIVSRYGPRKMLIIATNIGIIAALGLLVVSLLGLSYQYTVAILIPLMGSLGIMSTNSDAIILMKYQHDTGTVAAVIGTLRFGFGALSGPLLALFYTGTAVPFALLMLTAVVLVGVCQFFIVKT